MFIELRQNISFFLLFETIKIHLFIRIKDKQAYSILMVWQDGERLRWIGGGVRQVAREGGMLFDCGLSLLLAQLLSYDKAL